MSPVIEMESIEAAPGEQPALHEFEMMISSATEECTPIFALGPRGRQLELPLSLGRALRQVVHALVKGDIVFILSRNKELTTQEAADILNVSRPYLVKLLEEGGMPYRKIGKHRRIRFSDLMDFELARREERRQGLALLTQLGQELGTDD